MSAIDADLARLRAADPISAEYADQEASEPWVGALRARIASGEEERLRTIPPREPVQRRRRMGPLVLVALLVMAGGSALAVIAWRPDIQSAPNTPAGARTARSLLEAIARNTPTLPGEAPPPVAIPTTARVVFSARTSHGEYTLWRARNRDGRGWSTIYSSPRLGMAESAGDPPLPRPPFVAIISGGGSPILHAREIWGRASKEIARVEVVLKNGSRSQAILERGWFLFAQDFGHPKPVALLGFDRHGRVVARYSGAML